MKPVPARIFPSVMVVLIKRGGLFLAVLNPMAKCIAATTVTFTRDAIFGGKPVKAGTYTLFVIPMEQNWTIILNSQLGQWGAFEYDKYKDKDVLHVDAQVKKLDNVVEQLTISLPPNAMVIEWDNVQVSIPVSFT